MKNNYDKLMSLLYSLPDYNTPSGRNQLSEQIAEYKSILDNVNRANENYNRNTNIYYAGINEIERNLYYAKQAKTDFEKDQAFADAVKALRSYIKGLSSLLMPAEWPANLKQVKPKPAA